MRPEFIIITVFTIIATLGLVYWLGLVLFDKFLPHFYNTTLAKITDKQLKLIANRPDLPNSTYSYQLTMQYEYEVNHQKYISQSLNVFKHIKHRHQPTIENLIAEKDGYIKIFYNQNEPSKSYAFANTFKFTIIWIVVLIHLIGSITGIFLLITTF